MNVVLSGDLHADFDVTNNVLPTLDAKLDVGGAMTALDNAPGNLLAFGTEELTSSNLVSDRFNVGQTLDEFLKIKSLSADDMIQMVLDFAQQMTGLTSASAMSQDLPFVGMSVQDMVSFAKSLEDSAKAVQARQPKTVGEFGTALNDALQAAGFPAVPQIGLTVPGDALTVGFDATRSVTGTYPFNLDLEKFAGIDIPIAQVDGGATITATAGVDFHPTIGILFAGTGIADRVFVKDVTPTFTASLGGTVNGAISLGPLSTALNGDVKIGGDAAHPAKLEVALEAAADSNHDGRYTIAELQAGLVADHLVTADLSGPFSRASEHHDARGLREHRERRPLGPGRRHDHEAPRHRLHQARPRHPRDRRHRGSEVRRPDARDERCAADRPPPDRRQAERPGHGRPGPAGRRRQDQGRLGCRPERPRHRGDVRQHPEGRADPIVCPDALPHCTNLTLKDATGAITTNVHAAASFFVDFKMADEVIDDSMDLNGGIDLAPVFAVKGDMSPTVTYGYSFDVGFGLSINDGFYLKGGDVLSLYTKVEDSSITTDVELVGLNAAHLANGHLLVGGTAGPNHDAAGFSVSLPAKLRLSDLSNIRKSPDSIIQVALSLDASADLPIETTFTKAPNLKMPVHFAWSVHGTLGNGLDVADPVLSLGSATSPVTLDAVLLPDQRREAAARGGQQVRPAVLRARDQGCAGRGHPGPRCQPARPHPPGGGRPAVVEGLRVPARPR